MSAFENIYGIPSEVYHERYFPSTTISSALKSTPRLRKVLHVFFIPGNPGTLFFYIRFLQELGQLLTACPALSAYAAICCHGLGHAMHHLETSSIQTAVLEAKKETSRCDLEFQTHHANEFIQSVLSNRTRYEPAGLFDYDCMIVGHSIGAYIVLQILQQYPALLKRTKYLMLLMPFIAWSKLPTLHRAKLSSFIRLYPFSYHCMTNLAKPLLRMSSSLKRRLVGLATGHTGDVLEAIAVGLTSDRIVQNFLTMGADEIRHVRENEQQMLNYLIELDQTQREMEIVAVYTDDDDWAPLGDANELARVLTRATVIVEPGLTHAFALGNPQMLRTCEILTHYFGKLHIPGQRKLLSRL